MQSINELEILLKNIKTLREINHLSKKEMASILNISINTLNRIEKEIMPSDYISDYVLVEFEGEQFKAPVGYDSYLTKHYGDYMKLPPKEKQISNHNNTAYWR